jgi:hypothetical protein
MRFVAENPRGEGTPPSESFSDQLSAKQADRFWLIADR